MQLEQNLLRATIADQQVLYQRNRKTVGQCQRTFLVSLRSSTRPALVISPRLPFGPMEPGDNESEAHKCASDKHRVLRQRGGW